MTPGNAQFKEPSQAHLGATASQENVLSSRPLISTQEVLSLFMSLWLKFESVNMLQRYFLSFLPTHPPSSFYFIYLILAALVLHRYM